MGLTIVMYHYVREIESSRYPGIKGLSIDKFKSQLKYIQDRYTPVTMQQVIAASQKLLKLPENAILLTFDDGYADHFNTVFPILNQLGIQGSFFPTAKAITEHIVLDVNKLHFILATARDAGGLKDKLLKEIRRNKTAYNLMDENQYLQEFHRPSFYDNADVGFFKNMLQKGLPLQLRQAITDIFFQEYVGVPEDIFSRELYMSEDQLKCLVRAGMFVGSHGFEHFWMDKLDPQKQRQEVDLSLRFLKSLDIDIQSWVMCYPYGAWNQSLLEILNEKQCKIGLTTEVGQVDFSTHNPLNLPRVDTNELG